LARIGISASAFDAVSAAGSIVRHHFRTPGI
jgi:hypothetical protein